MQAQAPTRLAAHVCAKSARALPRPFHLEGKPLMGKGACANHHDPFSVLFAPLASGTASTARQLPIVLPQSARKVDGCANVRAVPATSPPFKTIYIPWAAHGILGDGRKRVALVEYNFKPFLFTELFLPSPM